MPGVAGLSFLSQKASTRHFRISDRAFHFSPLRPSPGHPHATRTRPRIRPDQKLGWDVPDSDATRWSERTERLALSVDLVELLSVEKRDFGG